LDEVLKSILEESGGLEEGLVRSEEGLAGLKLPHGALKLQPAEEAARLQGKHARRTDTEEIEAPQKERENSIFPADSDQTNILYSPALFGL
jgi:hypothetical protein